MTAPDTLRRTAKLAVALAALAAAPGLLHAAEHVTLRNGFEIDCARREAVGGGKFRLFLLPSGTGGDAGYIDVAVGSVLGVETFPDPVGEARPAKPQAAAAELTPAELTPAEMHTMLAKAGTEHHIDEDLLASVVKAESGGHALAVSRAGAQGLMQLMPATANELGVPDAFRPEQNIAGGTAYLDRLLVRYHDNAALALAAYNAGPGAVDKYHGIPPYRETRAYVARVIREFNRRKLQAATFNRQQQTDQIAGPDRSDQTDETRPMRPDRWKDDR